MKLRFKVNIAECFRRTIFCANDSITIEVDPATLSETDRNLIADRLSGIDVLQLWNTDKGTEKAYEYVKATDRRTGFIVELPRPILIEANAPSFEGLMEAIRSNQREVETRQAQHRNMAVSLAMAGLDLTKAVEGTVTVSLLGE